MSLYLFLEVLTFFSPSVVEHKPSVLKLPLKSLNFYRPHEDTHKCITANDMKKDISKLRNKIR